MSLGSRRFHCRFSFLSANDFLHERLETRIAVQRREKWIYFDPADVGSVAFLETLFKPAQRLLLIVQAEIKQSAPVAEHFAVLTHLMEIGQHLLRGTLVTSVSFSLSAERRHK